MIKFLRIVLGLVLLGVIVLLGLIFVPVKRTEPTQQLAADWQPAEGQGRYVSLTADCVACHTAPDGKSYAGGLPIESPLGTIWSTNITPDPETGIGNWSLDDFRAALVDGLKPDGTHLYPAMPYENYRLMTEEDIRALYDYLMNEVEPVVAPNPETKLPFPFNMRFGMRVWNWFALGEPGFKPMGQSELIDRGQYLVEGPAHCATCHSPRTVIMTQDGIRATDDRFLTGGVVAGWDAPALRGPDSVSRHWSVDQMAAYLSTGRNAHSVANGEMEIAVQQSFQHLTDEDILAMAAFVQGLDGAEITLPQEADFARPGPIVMPEPPATEAGAATEKMLIEASPDMPLGARLYLDNCVACHFATGKGAPEIFPELDGNSMVIGAQKGPLISVILHGVEARGTKKRPMNLVMQGYADRLNDAEVAELATFLRSAWGNDAGPVTAEEVASYRTQSAPH